MEFFSKIIISSGVGAICFVFYKFGYDKGYAKGYDKGYKDGYEERKNWDEKREKFFLSYQRELQDVNIGSERSKI